MSNQGASRAFRTRVGIEAPDTDAEVETVEAEVETVEATTPEQGTLDTDS